MDGTMHGGRLFSDVLHDVDFTRGRPAGRGEAIAEHPECRPDSLAVGDVDPGLDAAVSEAFQSLAFDPAGRVAAPGLYGFDDQVAIAVLIHVVRAVGIVFEFRVAPSVGAEIISPIRAI